MEPCCFDIPTHNPMFKLFHRAGLNLPISIRSRLTWSLFSISLVDSFTWQMPSCVLERASGCTAAEHHLWCEFVIWTLGLEFPSCPSHGHSLLTPAGTVLTLGLMVLFRNHLSSYTWLNVCDQVWWHGPVCNCGGGCQLVFSCCFFCPLWKEVLIGAFCAEEHRLLTDGRFHLNTALDSRHLA